MSVSYVLDGDYVERTRQLREIGISCSCARCVADRAVPQKDLDCRRVMLANLWNDFVRSPHELGADVEAAIRRIDDIKKTFGDDYEPSHRAELWILMHHLAVSPRSLLLEVEAIVRQTD